MDHFVTAGDLAIILGITERRVNQIAKEGILFSRGLTGKFDVVLCVENFYKQKLTPNENYISLDKERALHEKAKREKAEIELAKIKGKVYSEEEIELAIVPMMIAFRNRILAIAPTVAEKLVGRTAKEIEAILDKTNKEALQELSEYDQIKFGSSEYEVLIDGAENPEVST